MKRLVKILFLAMIAVSLVGCATTMSKTLKQTPQEKKIEEEKVAEKTLERATIEQGQKGKAAVYGAELALDHLDSTNVVIETVVAHDWIRLARLTLGPPSVEAALEVDRITSALLKESGIELEVAKSKKARAEAELASTNEEHKALLQDAEEYKQEAVRLSALVESGKKAKSLFEEGIVKQERAVSLARLDFENKLEAVKKQAALDSRKAQLWDIENSFLNSINPLHDLFKFVKKLFSLGIFLVLIVCGFKILSLLPVCAPFTMVIEAVFGFVMKTMCGIFPAAKRFAGMVGKQTESAMLGMMRAIEASKKKLDSQDFAKEILGAYDHDMTFNKTQVESFMNMQNQKLKQHLKDQLNNHHNKDDRALVEEQKRKISLR